MKISASIYASKNRSLSDTVKLLDSVGVDYFHVDCNDDMSVFDDIKEIKRLSKTPIDLHLITDKPEEFIRKSLEHKVEQVSLQYENIKDIEVEIPKNEITRFGLAITSETPISVFDSYDNLSFLLLMCTTPGKSGGSFEESNYDRIETFKKKYSNKIIEVDGGVDASNAQRLKSMGVHCVVSGSFLMSSNNLLNAMYSLKNNNGHDYVIKDFMFKLGEIPLVSVDGITLKIILESIKSYKMGFCVITNNDGTIHSVVCDGDVREWLLNVVQKNKNLDEYQSIMNENPFTVNENSSIFDLLDNMSSDYRTINFIPVTKDDHKLVGVVSFNNIIRGQL